MQRGVWACAAPGSFIIGIGEIIILIREKQVGTTITPGQRLSWVERRHLFPK